MVQIWSGSTPNSGTNETRVLHRAGRSLLLEPECLRSLICQLLCNRYLEAVLFEAMMMRNGVFSCVADAKWCVSGVRVAEDDGVRPLMSALTRKGACSGVSDANRCVYQVFDSLKMTAYDLYCQR